MFSYTVRMIRLILLLIFPWFSLVAKTNLDIPPSLAPWQGWVLHGQEDKLCPIPYNQAEAHWCVWPSKLDLSVQGNAGKFTLTVTTYARGWIALPGEKENWPEKVKVNGKDIPVGLSQGKPAVYVEAGQYRIEGEFQFERLPDNLSIPLLTGLVTLTLEGKVIEQPDRDTLGKIWLRKPIQKQGEEDFLSLKVFRLIEDEIPLVDNTVLRLSVAGKTREVSLGPVLQHDALPLQVQSPLPYKLEENGEMRLQIKPGTWDIVVKSRFLKNESTLHFQKRPSPWPHEELWAFKMNSALRLMEVEGGLSLDPQQTDMPQDWKRYPTYLMQEGKQIKLLERRRGIEKHQVENVNLQRNMWLNFAGNEYIIQDNLSGNIQNHWRLQVDKNSILGRVNVDGQDRLITKLSPKDPDGVEIRQGQLNLLAVSQIPKKVDKLSATGWDLDVQSLSTMLYLPPGWKLLGAKGVDKVSQAWLQDWTLLDLFLVFIIAAAVMNLFGKKWGFVALLALVLTYHEQGAPLYSWLNLIAAVALLTVIPEGAFKKWMRYYYYLSLAVLIVITLPFLIKEIREALYPQLSITQSYYPTPVAGMAGGMEGGRLEKEVASAAIGPKSRALMTAPLQKMESMLDKGAPPRENQRALEEYDPNAQVQTGPGVPDWRFNVHQLTWNGPVLKDQVLRLWLIPATMVSLLKFLEVALVILLIYGLLTARAQKYSFGKSVMASPLPWIGIIPLLAILVGTPDKVMAQENFPSEELLTELRDRLLKAPECLPDCAQISRMKIDIKNNQLTIRLMAQVVNEAAIPLPSTLGQWMPQTVMIDNKPSSDLLVNANQQLWIKLSEGVHEVILDGAIGEQDKFNIFVPLAPKVIEAESVSWKVDGIFHKQLQGQNLYFSRIKPADESAAAHFEPGRIPSFVQLKRDLKFGLEWEIQNEVIRVAPQEGAINLTIPLLENEEVISENVEVKDKKIYVTLNPNEQSTTWKSKLKIVPAIKLKALDVSNVKEIWQVDTISQWHCDFQGIPIVHQQDAMGRWFPTFEPWPNEEVTIKITRPQAVKGQLMTIDNSRLQVIPGKRATENALEYNIRSNIGGTHVLEIPANAEIKEVMINQERQPLNIEKGKIILPINPGTQHVNVSWRSLEGLKTLYKTPQIKLNLVNSNSVIDLQLSKDRWILGLGGPLMGPAVLFWGFLLGVLVIAFGLGKTNLTPLNVAQWFLLSIGLLIATPWAVIIAVVWFVAFNQRKRFGDFFGLTSFRVMQVGLVFLTVIFIISLFRSISHGLLGVPEMQLGQPTTNLVYSQFAFSNIYQLQWYQDVNPNLLPCAWVLSLPLFVYRTLMLLWALWLAFSLLKWLRWAWECFASGGLWREKPPVK